MRLSLGVMLLWTTGCATKEPSVPPGEMASKSIATQHYTGENAKNAPAKSYADKTVPSKHTEELNTRADEEEKPEVKSKTYKPVSSSPTSP